MRGKKFLSLIVLSVLASVFFVGMQARPAFADGMAYWRLVHAAPDVTSADVFVDGVKLVGNFQFGTVSGYVPTPVGSHIIQVAVVGAGIGASVMSQNVTVNAQQPYTLVILGTQKTGYSLDIFQDNNSPSPGAAKVRAYHLSPDAGPINVGVGTNTVVNDLTYQHASDYFTVPSGSYTFDVTATQTSTTIPQTATLNENVAFSVFTIGLLSGTPNLQVVTANAFVIPGMPQTGSDPTLAPAGNNTQPIGQWFLVSLALVVVGAGVARRTIVRRQKRV